MQLLHDEDRPATRHASPPRPRSPARAWLPLAALAAAGLGLVGCGSSGSPAPTILNTEKIERSIEQSTLAQRNRRVNVTCPSGVHQTKGLAFSCTAVFKGGTTRFVVTEVDGVGNVHYVAP